MSKLSASQRTFLLEATREYKQSLKGSAAEEFLETRGLSDVSGNYEYRLGYVRNPLPGHERYRGRLSIPFLRRSFKNGWSVTSIRFRCVRKGCDHSTCGGKYLSAEGDTPRLYNTVVLQYDTDIIGISEGELDAVTATECGVPTVGAPGVETWKKHFAIPFLGYEHVFIFEDGDDAGHNFSSKLAKILPNSRVIPFGPGEDVNSTYTKYGEHYLKDRLGLS